MEIERICLFENGRTAMPAMYGDNEMKKRYAYIDYAKGITIIMVVLSHVGYQKVDSLSNICMILLFIASGFTFSDKGKSVRELTVSRFKRIILPYWKAVFVYAVFEIWRAGYFGYADYKIFFGGIGSLFYGITCKAPVVPGVTDFLFEIFSYKTHPQGFLDIILPTNGHLWFLPAMFTGSVIFFIYTHYAKKRGLLDVLMMAVLLALAYPESIPDVPQLPFSIGAGFFCCACLIAGLNLRCLDIFALSRKNYLLYVLTAAVTLVLSCYLDVSPGSFVNSDYPLGNIWGVYLFFLLGVAASVFLLFTLKLISEKIHLQLLLDIGKNTMTIYLWHMIFLTVFGIIVLKIFVVPAELDIYAMAFIPADRTDLRLLVSALSIIACLLLARIVPDIKKEGKRDKFK